MRWRRGWPPPRRPAPKAYSFHASIFSHLRALVAAFLHCSLHFAAAVSSGHGRAAQPEAPGFSWFLSFLIARANTGCGKPTPVLQSGPGLDSGMGPGMAGSHSPVEKAWTGPKGGWSLTFRGGGLGGRILGWRPLPSGPCMRLEPDRPCKPWLTPAAVVGCRSRLVKSFFHHLRPPTPCLTLSAFPEPTFSALPVERGADCLFWRLWLLFGQSRGAPTGLAID